MKKPKEPTTSEVMRSALLGAGITKKGFPAAKRLWTALLPEIEHLEETWPENDGRPGWKPTEIEDFVRRVVGVIVVRRQFAAALRAKRRTSR